MKRVFLYSGQGSQYFQMGRELFEQDPVFRATFTHYDALASRHRGSSLASVVYAGDRRASEPFDALEDTHFAIPVIQLALTEMLDFKGFQPDIVIGTSLGEYVALVVAGLLTPEALFEVIALQVSLLRSQFGPDPVRPAQGMVSVFVGAGGVPAELGQFADSFAGRVGADTIVYAGTKPTLDRIVECSAARGLLVQPVGVQYAFHNTLMEPLRASFVAGCPSVQPGRSTSAHLSCVVESRSSTGPESLFEVMRRPFDFHGAFQRLDPGHDYHFSDLSPAGIYTRPVQAALAASAPSRSRIVPLLSALGSDLTRWRGYQREAAWPQGHRC